jgi:hypothetical protein
MGKNMGSSRSTPITSDPWIKTTKNATNPKIKFRAIFWDNFLGKFLGENWRNWGVKFVATFALIPYDAA